ncbi:GNAT family N-acetyltransferase [Planococcus sp. CPCC 101016]|uniref:GNAT family N-acetyltransferase n=1 Tax=Planococcus sp. CPCC 101016 TaxID=2599617 RepID=UPI0021BD139D|nr:GNAT family protein [Planococcus sp. CPCC 101016]
MNYTIQAMSQKQAEEIAANWHYAGEYSFYDMDADQEDLQAFLDQKMRKESYFIIKQNNEVIGFYSFIPVGNNTIDIGLGMKPNLTGNGKGFEFLKVGLDFAKSKYDPEQIILSVATFNKRAIKVYKKIGFKEVEYFMQTTNGGNFEFLKMIYVCKERTPIKEDKMSIEEKL